MPWSTPTLREVRSQVRDYIQSTLPGSDAAVPNSVLRVLSDSQGGLCHLTLQYIDWLALQLLPDTAEGEWLDRHGKIWLVNADGSTGRKMATLAHGSVDVTATVSGVVIPTGSQLQGSSGLSDSPISYETIEDATSSTSGPVTVQVRALDPGSAGNLPEGSHLAFTTPIAGIDQTATVRALGGGTDDETDEQLRDRILRRIRQPPMGGAEYDYEQWALAVPGVTRAWAAPEQGTGTITVRFLMDDLRADNDGWPTPEDIQTVHNYIDLKRPVTVKDCYVLAPIKQFIDITIAHLVPDTEATRAEIEASVREMLFEKAAPGQTIYASWVNYAIMSAPSVVSFNLVTTDDYVMPSLGHMAVLETILYDDDE